MAELETALRVSHLTLAPSNVVTHSIVGYFSQTKHPEIVFVKGNGQWLQLSVLISSSLHSICCANTFGQIRTINKVPSSNPRRTDCIAITTSGGKLMILQYDKRIKSQNAIQCFTILTEYRLSTKTGCRKDEAGQYAQCIPLKPKTTATQSNQYLFFISAPFETHLFVKLTMSIDGRQCEWSKLAQYIESNGVIFDTAFTYLMGGSHPTTESLYCVSLQCTMAQQTNVCNKNNKEPPTKKRKLNTQPTAADGKCNSDAPATSMTKTVKFYKMDLENNDIGVVYSVDVSNTSHLLISVPFNREHHLFGGILLCSANIISYIKPQSNGQCQQLHGFIPQRILEKYEEDETKNTDEFDLKPQDIVINAYDIYYNDADALYLLLQTDRGDMCKLCMLSNTQSTQFEAFSLQVLDAMPLSHSISIFPQHAHPPYIFFGAQNTDNYLCKMKVHTNKASVQIMSSSNDDKALLFEPKLCKHFKFIQEYPTFANLIRIQIDDLFNEIQPQIYCLCGRGQQSSLKILRYGVCVTRLGIQNLSQFPFQISRVWTVSTSITQARTSLLVVSTSKASTQSLTLLFKVTRNQEIIDIPPNQSPFDAQHDTLHFGTMYIGNNSNNQPSQPCTQNESQILNIASDTALVQITSESINFVTRDAAPYSWKPGGGQVITNAVCTSQVIIITLNDQFVLLLKPQQGKLLLAGKRLELQSQIATIAVPSPPQASPHHPFATILAVATANQHITIYQINQENGIEILNRFTIHSQSDSDKISSLCFAQRKYLFVGTQNGNVFRFSLAAIYNVLKPFNANFVSTLHSEWDKNLGSCAVRLVQCQLALSKATQVIRHGGIPCVVAISSKNYVITQYEDTFNYFGDEREREREDLADWQCDILRDMRCIPLIYSYDDLVDNAKEYNRSHRHRQLQSQQQSQQRIMFDDCASFICDASSNDPESDVHSRFIVIDSEHNNIQIYGIQSQPNSRFESTQFDLRYTPRDMTIYNVSKHHSQVIVIESDCREYSHHDRKGLLGGDAINESKQRIIGYPRPLTKTPWASCFRIINPLNPRDTFVQELDRNEAAFSITICAMANHPNGAFEDYLVIGTALGMTSNAINSAQKGCLRVYKCSSSSAADAPTLICTQMIRGLPKYIVSYRGGLLVAFGKKIEFYRFQLDSMSNSNAVQSQSQAQLINDKRFNIEMDRIRSLRQSNFYISKIEFEDTNDAEHLPNLLVSDNLNGFHLFRYNENRHRFEFVVSQSFVHRPLSSTLLDPQTLAISSIFGDFYISRIEQHSKFSDLVQFYVGDTITSIQKTKLSPLGRTLIVYGTMTGTIGVFIPFASGIDADFFDALQYYLCSKIQSLSGEAHVLFRSKYLPQKNCCDLDQAVCFQNIQQKHKDAFHKAIQTSMPKIAQNILKTTNSVF